ncbi:NADPH-cytochrome P450 reductase [Geopyxis carbonaria]|nr:NADPH-cytochrome P450 reductase [Geopyxis carbonaria]
MASPAAASTSQSATASFLLANPSAQSALELVRPALQNIYDQATLDDYVVLAIVFMGTIAYATRKVWWNPDDPYDYIWYVRPQEKLAAGMEKKRESRNITQKMEEMNKDIVLFWGSQSGTSEIFTNRLARELHLRFGVNTLAADLSDYDHEHLAALPKTKLAFFLVSTYGEGDPSDNTQAFWEWMESANKGNTDLSNLRYFAFGFGNSDYKHYNRVVEVVDQKLTSLGATRLGAVGMADDKKGGTEEDFLAWKDDLFTIFSQQLGYEEHEMVYEPTLKIEELPSAPEDLAVGAPNPGFETRKADSAYSAVKALPVKASRELFTTPTRNCLHMEIDLSSAPLLKYTTGDHLAVWPTNPDEEVSRLLNVLGCSAKANVPIAVAPIESTGPSPVPSPTTREALFRSYLEICAPVPRDLLPLLSAYAPNPAAKATLARLASREAWAQLTHTRAINFGKLLSVVAPGETWASIPLSFVIENLPKLQPRYYSISSSSIVSPRVASITAVVSTAQLDPSNPSSDSMLHGVTTNYLLALSQSMASVPSPHPHGLSYALDGPANALADGRLFVHTRKAKFRLPTNPEHPIVLIAAGTGIAPFRGFLQEKKRLQELGRPVGPILLFFGCRNPNEDLIYADEWADFKTALGDKFEMVTAFSRVAGEKKVYVQDRVREMKATVKALVVDQGANVYLCGSAAMAREVGFVLEDEVVCRKGAMEEMKRFGKVMEDVWG